MVRSGWIGILAVLSLAAGIGRTKVPESAFDKDPWPVVKTGLVKVFLLAGQSNMQGQAALRTLEYLIYNAESAAEYEQWKDHQGRWTQRRDVWVWTTDGARSGSLTPGFGATEMKMGPELGFGWVMVNQGLWKGPDWVRFYNVGSDRGYHYLGSARIYYRMGKAFAESMVDLLAN